MSEPGVREIQLSAKQVVFLFMAALVFAVVVFLLGVSVGRGVRDTGTAASIDVAAAPGSAPPATKTTPGDLTYHEALQAPRAGDATKTSSPPPNTGTAAATPPPPAAAAVVTPPPAKEPATPPVKPVPSPPPSTQKPAPAVTAPASGGYYVQVGSFRDRALAEKMVQDLKSQGFAASLQVVSASPPNRVRVGPFAERSAADEAARRLAKHKPIVTR